MKKKISIENKAKNIDAGSFDLSKNKQENSTTSKLELNIEELDIDFKVLLDFGIVIPELDMIEINNIELPKIDLNFPEVELVDMDILEALNFGIELPDFDVYTEE